MTNDQTAGKTTIAPGVLLTMTRLAALEVEGVSRMGHAPRQMGSLLRKGMQQEDGITLKVVDDTVYVDVYIVLHSAAKIREVSYKIQSDVARTIEELVGMNVGSVNVHVEDIDYPDDPEE